MGKLPNSAPDGFQRLADAAVEGQHYRDIHPLWGYLCKGQQALANDIFIYCTTSGGQSHGKLIKRLEDAIKAMRTAKKRGTWKPSRDMADGAGLSGDGLRTDPSDVHIALHAHLAL